LPVWLKERSCGFETYKYPGCKQCNCTVRRIVSKSIQENRPEVNRSESVNTSLGFLAVQQSYRVDNRRDGRVGRLISDCRDRDKLDELLIFTIVLLILINLTVILIILMSLTMVLMILIMILMIILTVRDKKSQWKTLLLAPWQ
jgi:Flp pilus assembly protein TadB